MINNHHKSTVFQQPFKIAGVEPSDDSIEFIASDNETALWIQNGCVHYFKDLPKWRYQKCQEAFLNDKAALIYLSQRNESIERQVEIFIHYSYGAADGSPDMIGDKLQPSENFRPTKNCPSLDWDSKWITIDGVKLTKRDLLYIDFVKEDKKDEEIAELLFITPSTLNSYKAKLYEKLNVSNKTALIVKALNQHV